MTRETNLSGVEQEPDAPHATVTWRSGNRRPARTHPPFLSVHAAGEDRIHRQAEMFYLQKQIQAQTPMVFVLTSGERIEGCIEWYDQRSLKVWGQGRMLIYKSAIKYMYKLGESGL
ncbi:MAG TPA: RNA chaperone Hfq [Terracidiphilus sp.]|nr:RNA chaperone Hfq [Terracidiphilus sp.]